MSKHDSRHSKHYKVYEGFLCRYNELIDRKEWNDSKYADMVREADRLYSKLTKQEEALVQEFMWKMYLRRIK